MKYIILLSLIFSFSKALAITAPSVFTYHGRIIQPSTLPLENSNVNFKIQVISPGPEACILYEEDHTKDMTASGGLFSIDTGSGVISLTDPGIGLTNAISNKETFNVGSYPTLTCAVGTSYTPVNGDSRNFRVSFDYAGSGGPVTISPDLAINSVPYSNYASSIEGLGKDDLLQVNTGGAFVLNQSNLDAIFTTTNYPLIISAIDGTHTAYAKASDLPISSGVLNLSGGGVRVQDTPATGDAAVNQNYSDIHMGGLDIQANLSTALNGSSGDGYVMAWDETTQTFIAQAAPSDVTKLPLAGGTMAGTINMNSNNITNSAHITMVPLTTINLGTYTDGEETTLIGGLGVGDKGKTWFNTTSNVMKYWDGSAAISSGADATKLPLAGGTMAGTINMNSNNITNIAHMIMVPQSTLHLGAYTDGQQTTLEGGLGAGDAGKTWYNTTNSTVMVWNGSASVTSGVQLGTAVGTAMEADSLPNCSAGQKIQASVGPTYAWTCVSESGDIEAITAGNGLSGTSLTTGTAVLNVNVDDATIEINSDTLRVKDGGVTKAKVGSGVIVDGGNSTGAILSIGNNDNFGVNFRANNTDLMTLSTNGRLYVNAIADLGSLNNSMVDLDATGTTISRNIADANTALIVEQTNAGSTGDILELKNDSGTVLVAQQDGNIGIGTTAPTSALHIEGDGSARSILMTAYTAGGSPTVTGQRALGTRAAPVAVGNGDALLRFNAAGYDGTSFSNQGEITISTNQTWNATDKGTKIQFEVTPNDTTTKQTALTIDHNSNIGMGVTSPVTTLDMDGAISVREMAAPAVSPSDQGRIYFDSGTDTFKISEDGGAYVDLIGAGADNLGNHTATTNLNMAANSILGGITSGDDLTLESTIHATKGDILLSPTSGNVGIGTTDAAAKLDISGTDQSVTARIINTDSTTTKFPGFRAYNYRGTSTSGSAILGLTYSRGTRAASSAVQSGDTLGLILFEGIYNGANADHNGASISAVADENFSGVAGGSSLRLSTTAIGATSPIEKLRIAPSGNVGLSVTDPATVLDIDGAFTAREMAAPAVAPSDQGRIYFDSGTDTFKISEDGGAYVDLVGAGADNLGNHTATTNLNMSTNSILGGVASSNNLTLESTSDATKGNVVIQPNGGRVGVGVSSPDTFFHVEGSSAGGAGAVVQNNNSASTAAFTYLDLKNDSSDVLRLGLYNSINPAVGSRGPGESYIEAATNDLALRAIDAAGNLKFYTAGLATANERMRIDSDGDVGIGTTNPSRLLTVEGEDNVLFIYDDSASGSTVSNGLTLRKNYSGGAGSDGIGSRINFSAETTTNDTFSTTAAISGVLTDATAGSEDGALTFVTTENGTAVENMRISGEGNVGIGTTSPDYPLNVESTSTETTNIIQASTYSKTTANPAAASLADFYGSRGYASSSSTNLAGAVLGGSYSSAEFTGTGDLAVLNGMKSFSRTYSTGTVASQYGASSSAKNSGGTVTSQRGVYSLVGNSDGTTGTVTKSYGFYADLENDSGTVTDYYGLYITDQGTNANYYSVYTAGTTKSYFGGNVGVGTTTPGARLHVEDDGNTASGILVKNSDAGALAEAAVVLESNAGTTLLGMESTANGGGRMASQ